MSEPITVLLVEDDPLFRMGLALFLRNQSELELVGEAEDGETALDLVDRLQPRLVLLDISLPGIGGQRTLERLKREYPEVRVLVLTSREEANLVQTILRKGADGYCLKGISPEHLLTVIREVSAGNGWFDAKVLAQVRSALAPAPGEAPGTVTLTEREKEVLRWIARGASNPEIGRQLHISSGTVRVHVHAILRKLGAVDRTQAVVVALEKGLIAPP
ncbi:response regulator [Gloeobacter morelensis]|uniref:Response regulator transcription factor n=1 Tax=Gloeobacter morelensis MG652769 TaxID=2781736 RepID=A0ABY3PIH2_9CYAN|nr:response regulator transcription factor [Gloeobacter morelensis]UFP93413.1 response regulator transcription factor [Gloeobacter morelensis MG652769]